MIKGLLWMYLICLKLVTGLLYGLKKQCLIQFKRRFLKKGRKDASFPAKK